MVGLICLALICLAAALAPWIAPFDPVQIKLSAKLKPPSFEHLLGTDHFGRDVFSRLLYGGRTPPSGGLPSRRLALLGGGAPWRSCLFFPGDALQTPNWPVPSLRSPP